MKLSSLKKKFKNVWVLAEVKETDEFGAAVDITPLAQDKSRENLVKKTQQTKPKHFTFIYTGTRKQLPRI